MVFETITDFLDSFKKSPPFDSKWLEESVDLHDASGNLHRRIYIPRRTNIDSLSASIQAVERLVRVYNDPVFSLCVSGGLDSQAMLNAWVNSNAKFKVFNVNYLGENSHDRDEIFRLAQTFGIEINTIDFDLDHFYETDYVSYILKYQCPSPQICAHMAFSEKIPGVKVFSGTPAFEECLGLNNNVYAFARYAAWSENPLVPFFFQSHQDLITSFSEMTKATYFRGFSGYESKIARLTSAGFKVIRPEKKYTGFEQIKARYESRMDEVPEKDRIEYRSLYGSDAAFDHILRHPYLKHFPKYVPKVIIEHRCS